VVVPRLEASSQVLLTRPPLVSKEASFSLLPLDLHVLGLPPAFNLSPIKKFNQLNELRVLATSVARHSFKSCNIFCCLLLQVPTQFAWLDILLKSVASFPKQGCVFYIPFSSRQVLFSTLFDDRVTLRFRVFLCDNGGEL